MGAQLGRAETAEKFLTLLILVAHQVELVSQET